MLWPTRYPMTLDEWTPRLQWASATARETWAARLPSISAAWIATERASVGVYREACRQHVGARDLPALSRLAARHGQWLVVLDQVSLPDGYRAAQPGPASSQGAEGYVIVLATSETVARQVIEATACSDDETLGRLYGYPPCCIASYRRVWVEQGWRDPTWPMVADHADGPLIDIRHAPATANPLLRWLGLRWIAHLPCRFDCSGSAAVGAAAQDLMRRHRPAETDWLAQLLAAPMEWSAWHGIGQVRHPLFRFAFRTDATAERLVIRWHGTCWPEAGARGVAYPYTEAPATVQAPVTLVDAEWLANGFRSRAALEAAHAVLARVYAAAEPVDTVLDLGCGTALLLERVRAARRLGVEQDGARAARARQRLGAGGEIVIGDVRDPAVWPAGPLDVVLLMPGRLLEATEAQRVALRASLRARARRVLVYAYGDWIARYGDLDGLVAVALGGSVTDRQDGEGVSAGWWRPDDVAGVSGSDRA